ncbi:nuclear transport factor 2 family protein [Acrocarpospora macrocephala]|uniref:Ketosteroid isomerase n=1 Tax=Acrocarpospora macrocephala TaxID=150177 RepID=A0A5M3X2P5_9ACTN|nr:nuclear transport factor 2 family protein [Acrocarpospora macrocephala]GES13871.1 ketosteroid isomerase [Acrocarpospora macrocephala]
MAENHARGRQALARFYAEEEAYLARAGADQARLLACFAEDVVIREAPSLPYGGDWYGHAGVLALMNRLSEVYERATFEDRTIFADGDDVFVLLRSTVRFRASGRELQNTVLQHIVFRDGLIAAMSPFHWDTQAVVALAARTSQDARGAGDL